MLLIWGADYIKNTLPDRLKDRFEEIKSDPHHNPGPDDVGTLPLYDGKTGKLVVKIPGGVTSRVSREKLRKLFSEDLDICVSTEAIVCWVQTDQFLQFSKTAQSIAEHGDQVTVHFEDGTSSTGDTIVCCDSIRGIGRKTLLGEEKAALSTAPCSVVNIGRKFTAEQARFIRGSLDPVIKFAGHPDQPTLFLITSIDIGDLDRPEDWKIQLLLTTWGASPLSTNAERVRVFKEAASKYAEPWRSAALWVPDDTFIPPDRIRYWANPTIWPNWNGKVTLAGDAAHPMTPFRAQGLNNAMQDAHNYVQGLLKVISGEKTLVDAITDYGNETLERGAAEIKLSSVWGPTLHDWQKLMNTPMMKQGYGKTESNEKSREIANSGAVSANGTDEKSRTYPVAAQTRDESLGAVVLPVPTVVGVTNRKSAAEQEAALAPSEMNMGDEHASATQVKESGRLAIRTANGVHDKPEVFSS